MSAIREFNLKVADDPCEVDDVLCFSKHELSTSDTYDGELGICISLTLDYDYYDDTPEDEREGYEIYRNLAKYSHNKVDKKRVNNMNIATYLNDTEEIRDLGQWLLDQADLIENEKEQLRE
jgi:hypothetical protein